VPPHHVDDLLSPLFTDERLLILAESVSMTVGMGELLMRRKLRKTLPFIVAIFIGTMAAALIAGVAILAAHS
jgi:prepilin signal peptidase PulO-like enzyme (type II secretory pathway)